ncbi:tripartite tricarboxylate transporter substrate binding protein [soil metagenome]
MQRRTFLATASAALVSCATPAWAAWPERPVRILVPYAPGGPVDLVARLIGDKLAAKFGQSFVIENKPGANGAIGVQALMAAPADGYSLLMHGSAGVTIYQAVMKQPAFDPLRDLTPITLVDYFDLILCANPGLPIKDVKEFVAYAKANPGKLSYGTAGIGAMNHVGTEWFKTMTGIDIVHVPYRGDAPVAADVMSGTLGVAFVSSNVAIPLIRAGKLRALAVPSRQRMAVLPDVPTMAESGYPDLDLQPWTGFFGPAGLDKSIVSALSAAMKEILAQPDVAERLAGLAMVPAFTTPEEFADMIRKSIALWKDVAGRTKIVVE